MNFDKVHKEGRRIEEKYRKKIKKKIEREKDREIASELETSEKVLQRKQNQKWNKKGEQSKLCNLLILQSTFNFSVCVSKAFFLGMIKKPKPSQRPVS